MKPSDTHRFNVLRKEGVSPQNLEKDKRAGTLSNQVSWHFAEEKPAPHWQGLPRVFTEHQKFHEVKQDIWGRGRAGTDPAVKHKN